MFMRERATVEFAPGGRRDWILCHRWQWRRVRWITESQTLQLPPSL